MRNDEYRISDLSIAELVASWSESKPASQYLDKLYARPLVPRKHQARSKYEPHFGRKQTAKAANSKQVAG